MGSFDVLEIFDSCIVELGGQFLLVLVVVLDLHETLDVLDEGVDGAFAVLDEVLELQESGVVVVVGVDVKGEVHYVGEGGGLGLELRWGHHRGWRVGLIGD